LVGHVTKEGSIAGPKILEHLVDVVLNFEGDRYGGFRVVRAQKNRYGSTNEAAIFEMDEQGLRIVKNGASESGWVNCVGDHGRRTSAFGGNSGAS